MTLAARNVDWGLRDKFGQRQGVQGIPITYAFKI